MYDAPIPGQSLTTPPRQYPYERPPAISDPAEALEMHISRLGGEDKKKAILDALELDVDVVTLTEGLLRGAVASGIHSVDISQLIAPVIHKFIVKLADDAGVEYDEGFENKKEMKEAEEKIALAKAYKSLGSGPAPKEESVEMEEEEPAGLVARRSK